MSESKNTHGHDHGETPSYDDINTPVIVLVGAISAIVTLVTIMFVQGMCYQWKNSFIRQRSMEPTSSAAVQEVRKQQAELESAPVAIADAMKQVVAKYQTSH